MKTRTSILLVAALAVSIVPLGAGWAQAAIYVLPGDTVSISLGTYYTQNGETGGEFAMMVSGNSAPLANGMFYTFCADPTEFINTGTNYTVAKVANANDLGYSLSNFGKWIYYEFSQGGYGSGAGLIPGHLTLTADLAGAIQEGIWSQLTNGSQTALQISGWTTPDNYKNTIWPAWQNEYDAWVTSVGGSANADADLKDVGIAQLQLVQQGSANQNVQNQMVLSLNVTPTSLVPEPAAIVIWSLLGAGSWLGIKVWRRRGPALGDEISRPARQPWSPEARQAIHELIAHGSRQRG